jgi:hypothetical protein
MKEFDMERCFKEISVEDELSAMEKYIKTLSVNDETYNEINKMIADGVSKGLVVDFIQKNYRGTIFSVNKINQEQYDSFQNYINRCEKEENDKYLKWKQEIIDSGIPYSQDELKYDKRVI